MAGLKSVYSELRARFPNLPDAKTKPSMAEALNDYESAHENECELSESSDQFYGYTKGANLFARHLQFIFVPAVKDAVSEQDEARTSALGQLLARTIRTRVNFKERLDDFRRTTRESYGTLFSTDDAVLGDISESLQRRLRDWTTEESRLDLKWHYDDGMFDKISEPFARLRAGDSRFLGELVRLGHGMQRTIIVSLLQELAESSTDGPRLLLCIEEPELYQHPPQARHLADVLESLSQAKTQCLVTTHSPIFVSSRGFEAVRSVGINPDGQTRVRQLRLADLAARLGDARGKDPAPVSAIEAHLLQVLEPNQAEMFFCSTPVLVEGAEDAALVIAQLHLSKMWGTFRKLGGLIVTSTGKSKLPDLLAICQGLEIPAFTLFDADGDKPKEDSSHKLNDVLFKLLGHEDSVASSVETIWGNGYVVWPTSLTRIVHDDSSGQWGSAVQKVRAKNGLTESVTTKNRILLGLTLNYLSEIGVPIPSLESLVSRIMKHAAAHASRIDQRSS